MSYIDDVMESLFVLLIIAALTDFGLVILNRSLISVFLLNFLFLFIGIIMIVFSVIEYEKEVLND